MSKLFHIFIVFVYILNTFEISSANVFFLAIDIISAGDTAWNYVNHLLGIPSTEDKLFEKMEVLQNNMDQLNSIMEKVESEIQLISDFIQNLSELLKHALRLNDLRKDIVRLNALYENYEHYSKNISHFERHTLEDFAETVISHESNSVGDLVNQIHALIVPLDNGLGDSGILHSVASSLKRITFAEHCKLNQSPHQVLYNIYNYIALMELKGYIMKQFSYTLLKIYNKGNFTSETQVLREKYIVSTEEEIKVLKSVIQPLSQVIWKCDPYQQIAGTTYLEITEFIQGYIQNEVDLNLKGTCTRTCETQYKPVKSYSCSEELCRHQRKCNGDIVGCMGLGWAVGLVTCTEIQEYYPGTTRRRYSHMYLDTLYKYTNASSWGHIEKCRHPEASITVYNWRRWFVTCQYCFCLCHEEGEHSDRYFNLRPVMADIKNNRVVTGLRFVKKNRIIHLQIQEGKLLPRGSIEGSTVRWVPAEDYRITDQNISNGRDYHTLTWTERGIDLDDVLTPKGHVLIGICFTKIQSRPRLSIITTAFDFATGLLLTTTKATISSGITQRTKLELGEHQDGLTSYSTPQILSVPDSTSHSYVEFTYTDIIKDLAQNTMPYLDAQPVVSLIPVPLGGAGIYHKGGNGCGGFIAPKIMTYDFTQHLQSEFPKST